MSKIIIRADGSYIEPFDDGRMVPTGGVAVIDPRNGDCIIRFAASQVTVEESIDPFKTYNLSDPSVAAVAVLLGAVTHGDVLRVLACTQPVST